MKRISISIATALMICTMSAATATAKVRSRAYGVGQDFVIAGTTVKAGTYHFSFDDRKNELTVTDSKTKKVVAQVEAHTEGREKGSFPADLMLTGEAAPLTFAGLSFDGKRVIRVTDSAARGK